MDKRKKIYRTRTELILLNAERRRQKSLETEYQENVRLGTSNLLASQTVSTLVLNDINLLHFIMLRITGIKVCIKFVIVSWALGEFSISRPLVLGAQGGLTYTGR